MSSSQNTSSVKFADAGRQLIKTYQESEWRATRVQVLKELGSFHDSRSLQFLIEVISQKEDLALQELALFSLANRKSRGARIFLKKYYARCPDTLRPKTAFALGLAQVFEMSPKLLSDFDLAYSKQDLIWLKNIVLALGELKEFSALPKLRRLLEQQVASAPSDLNLAILFSLARLERNSAELLSLDAQFFDDSLLYQVYLNTLAMIQTRQQFKLEDYLSKIFEGKSLHPSLPLELRSFDQSEVELGLTLFSVETHWKQFLFASSGLSKNLKHKIIEEIFEKVFLNLDDQSDFFKALAEIDLSDSINLAKKIEAQLPRLKSDLSLRLLYLQAFAEVLDLDSEAQIFLAQRDDVLAVQFLNLWSEIKAAEDRTSVEKCVKSFRFQSVLSDDVLSRYLRALAELGVEDREMSSSWLELFKKPKLRSSLLVYADRFSLMDALQGAPSLSKLELEGLGLRVAAAFESLASSKELDSKLPVFENILVDLKDHSSIEVRIGVLRCLRVKPLSQLEAWVLTQAKAKDVLVELNAVIALKAYKTSREASELLSEKLETSKSAVVQGRALDALCAHQTLVAKRAVLLHLKLQLMNEEVVDKIYRSFDSEAKGGDEFVKALTVLMNANPDHPSWEKLLSLRDRLAMASPKVEVNEVAQTTPELELLDQRLLESIPKFKSLDQSAKLALRAAEQPFMQAVGSENLPIDKAPTVLEYCKALDLILEKHLGQKFLFPKLDRELHDFQTLWHRVGFGEEYPDAQKVLGLLGLKTKIAPEHFPLHKARLMCTAFFNGKIVQDRFKIFDGLRAWAVIFLFFTRKIPLQSGVVGPLLAFPQSASPKYDEKCIAIAKKLMQLQDLRNPAAHRQTYTELASVKTVRNDSVELINTILDLVL